MKGKLLWSVFLALIAVFLVVFIFIFMPIRVPLNFLFLVRVLSFIVPCALLLLLGVALLVLTVRERVAGIPGVFLLLTGASAAGMIVSIIMHNITGSWLGIEEPVSFVMAVFVCPIAFLVGAVGSVVLILKKSPPHRRKR